MRVSLDMLDKTLSIYKPNYRYLKDAEIDFPRGRGRFHIGETEYVEALRHMTDVEAQLCLNQLCYVFFGQAVIENRHGNSGFTFDDYLDSRKDGMFITTSHKTFRRETNPEEPFYGHINLIKARKQGNIYVAKLSFDLNEAACIGELGLVLKR